MHLSGYPDSRASSVSRLVLGGGAAKALLVPNAGHTSQPIKHISPMIVANPFDLADLPGAIELLRPEFVVEPQGSLKLLKLVRIRDANS